MDGATVKGLLDIFIKRAAVMRRIESGEAGWRSFCPLTATPVPLSLYHSADGITSAKGMTELSLAEGPEVITTRLSPERMNSC